MNNILGLFDGMSCTQIALERLGIKYNNYYASEIDKYCISITQKNYPATVQLGDIKDIKGGELPPISLMVGALPVKDLV